MQVGVLIGRHELLGRVLQATWAHLRGQNREPAKVRGVLTVSEGGGGGY